MKTILHKFYENVKACPGLPCFMVKEKTGGAWIEIGWQEVLAQVACLANRLKKMGVQKGDFVVIYSGTRYEWTVIDLAILTVGAVSVPIYNTQGLSQISYIINHSTAGTIFVEDASLLKGLEEIRNEIPRLERVILIDGIDEGGHVVSLSEIMKDVSGDDSSITSFGGMIDMIDPGDIATCIYTSGTTGEPKGAEITHANIMGEVEGIGKVFHFKRDEIGLLFLPLAHVIARAMQFFQLSEGFITAYAESIDKLAENIVEVKPHFMVVVPRVMEKIYERIMKRVSESSFVKRFIFNTSLNIGKKVGQKIRQHRAVPFYSSMKYWFVQKVIFSELHQSMGGRLVYVISGGAPLDKNVAEFFHALGILVLEGYGLTETIAAVTINRPNDFKFGTVGKPLDGVQIRIADDKEILVKGPQVFRGYKEPSARPDDDGGRFADGWFMTGDLGEFSRDGFLRITGRKKEIIITASGKNIAPQHVENVIKSSSYISDVVVFGDRKKYLVALVTVDASRVRYPIKDRRTYELIKSEIECKNKQLARHETVKKFCIIDHDFTQEGGELTPTLKYKRQKIYEIYKGEIEGMY